DLIVEFENDQPVLTREDADFDGRFERVTRADADGNQVLEADENGDGRPELWVVADADGTVLERREDRDGDGQPDVTIRYRDGKPLELVQTGGGARIAQS